MDLVAVDAWVRVADVEADQFGDERPEGRYECNEEEGLVVENVGPDPAFEIKTDLCNYGTVGQPSLAPIVAGDEIKIRGWHWDLESEEPAEAHIAIAIGDQVVWEELIAIPSPASMLTADLVADRDAPQGTEVQFHVHNHGINSYDVISVEVLPQAE